MSLAELCQRCRHVVRLQNGWFMMSRVLTGKQLTPTEERQLAAVACCVHVKDDIRDKSFLNKDRLVKRTLRLTVGNALLTVSLCW